MKKFYHPLSKAQIPAKKVMSKTMEVTEMEELKKATGASVGRGDEREKAGEKKEEGEKRADLTESSSVPAAKEMKINDGTDKDFPEDKGGKQGNLSTKENPPGSPAGATTSRGDEREKAGKPKEEGEKRA